jgi:hypothetical protein
MRMMEAHAVRPFTPQTFDVLYYRRETSLLARQSIVNMVTNGAKIK